MKKIEKKSHCVKKRKGGASTLVWFFMLFVMYSSKFVRFVEQTERKFRRFEFVLKKDKTGTSQVSAISKAQIKSRGTLWRQKRFREKVEQSRKKTKGGPFTLIRFGRLRSKSKKPKRGPFGIS